MEGEQERNEWNGKRKSEELIDRRKREGWNKSIGGKHKEEKKRME